MLKRGLVTYGYVLISSAKTMVNNRLNEVGVVFSPVHALLGEGGSYFK